jgi:hypothetical protein
MTTQTKVGSRPGWGTKIVDGALWAVGATLVGFVLHKIFPTEPTVVVLARGKNDEDEDKDE